MVPDFHYLTGVKLRFTLSPKLQAYHVKLVTNYPAPGEQFDRKKKRELELYDLLLSVIFKSVRLQSDLDWSLCNRCFTRYCLRWLLLSLVRFAACSQYTHSRLSNYHVGERHAEIILSVSGSFEFAFNYAPEYV